MNKNDKYLEQNIEKLVQKYGGQRKMDETKKEQIIEKLKQRASKGDIKTPLSFYRFRKFAVAAAAVLVLGVLLFYVLNHSEQKNKIPPELAAMSAEQLMELHYHPSKTTYAPEIVKAALEQALEKIDPKDVIEIAQSVAKQSGRGTISASLAAPPVHPLSEFSGYPRMTFPSVVEESNLMVHGRLVRLDINVDDIIAALLEKERAEWIEDWMSKYRVTVQLDVLDVLPENVLEIEQIITAPAVINDRQLNALNKAGEYFVAMVQDAERKPKFLDTFTGIYPVDYNNPVTAEFWQFFADAYDVLLFGNQPSQETIDYWAARIEGESPHLALEYMDILPDELIPAGSIINAIENKYTDLIAQVQQNYSDAVARGEADIPIYADGNARTLSSNNQPLFVMGINLLLRADDKDSINRILTLFDGDIDFGNKSILWRLIESRTLTTYRNYQQTSFLSLIVRLNIASQDGNPGDLLMETYNKYKDKPVVNNFSTYNPSRALRNQTRFAQSLLNEIIDQAGAINDEGIVSLYLELLSNPSEYGIGDAETFKKMCMNLASNESYDIRPYLEKFLTSADVSDMGFSIDSPVFDRTSNLDPKTSKGTIDYFSNRSAVFEFELAAFDTLQLLPEPNRPSHKELLNWLLIIYERNKNDDACRTSINNELKKILRPEDTEIVPVLEDFLGMEYIPNRGNDTDDIIINIIHDPNLIPFIREAIDKTPNNSDTASLIKALYVCGAEEEAITKALEILNLPLRQERAYDLFRDMYRNAEVLLFLGKTQREELIPVIEGYTQQEYIDHYLEVYSQLDDSIFNYYRLIDFQQKALMALTRLGAQSVVPRLLELYDSPDIRIRIVSAIALYYNGDTTGEELVRYFVEGTYRDVPEIDMRLGVDMNEKDVFQDVISSYLRNDLTDALWLEKLTFNIDRMSDRDVVGTGFFKDYRSDILNILVEQLNNKNRAVRGFAIETLQQATGQNFGFQFDRYVGQQEEIIRKWTEYIDEQINN